LPFCDVHLVRNCPALCIDRQFERFDVSFPEKVLKTAATRGEISSLKFTKYRLASELRPDPLVELKRSTRHPIRNKGACF